jgi:hypothetical protein
MLLQSSVLRRALGCRAPRSVGVGAGGHNMRISWNCDTDQVRRRSASKDIDNPSRSTRFGRAHEAGETKFGAGAREMRRATGGCQKEILERLEKSRLVVVIRGFRGTNGGCPHRMWVFVWIGSWG